ncbi:hypothetical protein J4410_00770 [Candidatus Woesearchaeota archaeon]|nr:hypothetical protein [Candidatus Woesearchaeota archaeon]
MKVIIYTKDLMDRSKIEAALKELTCPYQFYDALPSDLSNKNAHIVDLSLENAFDILCRFPRQCIAYGPHTQTELFKKAHALGCKNVLPRSAFFGNMKKVITLFLVKKD